jgi:hypothetical protein
MFKEPNESCYFNLMAGGGCEVLMADLRQTRTPDPNAGIDAVGWLFLAFAVAIIATAAVIAYEASNTMVANGAVSHVVAR